MGPLGALELYGTGIDNLLLVWLIVALSLIFIGLKTRGKEELK